MRFFEFGFLDFFGILAPGVIFLLNTTILIYSILNLSDKGKTIIQTIQNSSEIQTLLQTSGGAIVISLILIIICYLVGFILRLIVPDNVDKAASFYLKLIAPRKRIINKYRFMFKLEKEKKLNNYNDSNDSEKKKRMNIYSRIKSLKNYLENIYYPEKIAKVEPLPPWFWSEEKYPYVRSTQFIYNRDLPKELTIEIMKETKYLNKNMYNYWKELLSAKNQNIYSMISQAEAYVRFMCGSFWALFVGLISGIFLIKISLLVGIFVLVVSLLMINILLRRFKNQRRREVKMLLDGIIIITGGKNISEFSILKDN